MPTAWVPTLLFALLGVFFLQKAIRPGARQSWSWGRGGGRVPLSRWSYAACAGCFFAIAAIVSSEDHVSMVSVTAFGVAFVAALVAGFLDTRRYEKARRGSDGEPSRHPEP